MARIRRLVLDVLKPHEPSIIAVADRLGGLRGVSGVNLSVLEIDKEVENIKLIIEGRDVSYERVKELIEDMGATIHSIDEVVSGKQLIKEVTTPEERGKVGLKWLR